MLRTNRSETKNNKSFNRIIHSEKKHINKRNKNYDIKKRSQTPNASRYNTFKNKKNNYKKFFRADTVSSAYSKNLINLKEQVMTKQIKNID